jgi:hypothetical protein
MAIENIRRIPNPLLRAITAGIFLGSLVTIPTALAIQMGKSQQDSHADFKLNHYALEVHRFLLV